MEIEKSRNGFYTVTFENEDNLSEDNIRTELGSVGQVCAIVWKKQRVFIRFKFKEEAERALKKYGPILKLKMAFNSERRSRQPMEDEEEEEEDDDLKKKPVALARSKSYHSISNMDNSIHEDKTYCLILSHLPEKYNLTDVKALVEETNPLWIDLDETSVFNIRFAYIVVDSFSKVTYLTEKLNGFLICGEKLTALEANELLKWRYDGKKVCV